MGATRQVTLWCDDNDCVKWLQMDTSRVAEAREHAHAQEGWASTRAGKDYCPQHRLTAAGRVRR